jgi:hypothetical protein
VEARFSTGREGDPSSCIMHAGSFTEVKWPGSDVDHPFPYSRDVKGRVELYLYSYSGLSWQDIG